MDVDTKDDTKDDTKEQKEGVTESKARPYPFRPFYQYQWLDVKDSEGTWLEAQILDLNDSKIRIHYKGFPAKYDEDISVDEKHPQFSRLAPLHTQTKCPEKFSWNRRFFVGMTLDVQDSSQEWLPAKVIEVSRQRMQIKVHYHEYAAKYDEWINLDSYRVAPLSTYTKNHNLKPATPPELPKKHAYLSTDKERKFLELLKSELGLAVVPMDEDGNCLFRAVAHQVYGDADQCQIVREKCLEYMKSQQDYFESFIAEKFEDYVARLQKDGEWGDQPEIQAMSELYGRTVKIFAYSTTPMKSYGSAATNKPPINLTYHFQSHYNSAINPKTHAKTVLECKPGEVEDAHIRNFCRLGTVDKVHQMYDVEATEAEQLRTILTESRKQFDSDNAELLERIRKAKADSLKTQREMESKQIEKATLDSLKECRPIFMAHQWGFNIRDCHEAYTLFKAPGLSDDIIAQRMIAYLLEERGQF